MGLFGSVRKMFDGQPGSPVESFMRSKGFMARQPAQGGNWYEGGEFGRVAPAQPDGMDRIGRIGDAMAHIGGLMQAPQHAQFDWQRPRMGGMQPRQQQQMPVSPQWHGIQPFGIRRY